MKKIVLFLMFAMVFSFSSKADTISLSVDTPSNKAVTDPSKLIDLLANNLVASVNGSVSIPATKNCRCDSESNMWIAWTLISIIVIGFLALTFFSRVLRDSVSDEGEFMENARKEKRFANKDIKDIPKPYSLARTQLGVWTVIISCSYVYVAFQCCNTVLTFNTTVLALMGISLATTTVGGSIDKSQNDTERHQNTPSRNLLIDIISDENGVSIHRFQNVVFTLIAMAIYIHNICPCGPLPVLDSTLLALTGASSAAYLGLKLNENKGSVVTTSPEETKNKDQDINPVG